MKLRDLITEARVFENNFIKISMIKEELPLIFGDNVPEIKVDKGGMYITLNNFEFGDYERSKQFDKFTLEDAGIIDEVKNIRKYYISYIKSTEVPAAAPATDAETPAPAA